jgi:hypothetical protein
MGVHVVPAFVVFHTPPDATATYHVRLSRGWTAISEMRPDVTACGKSYQLTAISYQLSAQNPRDAPVAERSIPRQ